MDHDAAWKRLFRQPLMVEHLLGGFAPEVAAVLDLATLRDLCASWAAADTEQRHGDAVWRVDYADGSGRSLVLLLEFQSTVDRAMAVRVQRYALMAGETLARTGARDADGELRVLPVVVHAGSEPWTARGAARAVAVTDGGEVQIPPPHVYLLLDAGRIAPEHRPAYNLVSTLFELNGAKAAAEVVAPMRALMDWLPERVECSEDVAREVAQGFVEWLATTMSRTFPEREVSRVVQALRRVVAGGEEAQMTQLEHNLRQWRAGLIQQGVEQGIKQGVERGIERGIEQGIARGLADERALLRRQAARKFDAATAAVLARRLEAVTDAHRLAEVGDWIIDCDTGADLLERTGVS